MQGGRSGSGQNTFMALRKSLYVCRKAAFLYLDRGASGNMAEYQLLSAAGIRNYPGICYGIRDTEKRRKSVGCWEKVSENSDKIRGVFRKAAKRVYPAGIFLLAAAAGIFVLSRKPGKELRITCLDIGQGDGIVLEIPDGGVSLWTAEAATRKIQPSINFCLI